MMLSLKQWRHVFNCTKIADCDNSPIKNKNIILKQENELYIVFKFSVSSRLCYVVYFLSLFPVNLVRSHILILVMNAPTGHICNTAIIIDWYSQCAQWSWLCKKNLAKKHTISNPRMKIKDVMFVSCCNCQIFHT